MITQWYWKTQGKVHAPISTRELDRLIRQNQISEADEFCLSGTDDWMSSATVRALFAAESNDAASSATTAESAARLLSGAPRTHLKRQIAGESRFAALAGALRKGGGGLTEILGNFVDWLETAGEQLSRLATVLGRKTTLTMLVVILLAILFKNFEFGNSQAHAAKRFATTWDQIQALRQRETSKTEWQEFERKTLVWLEPTVDALKKAAERSPGYGIDWTNSRADAAVALRKTYFVGETLRRLIKAGPEWYLVREESFLNDIDEVQAILSGEASMRHREPQRMATRMAAPSKQTEPFLSGIVVVDAVLICAGAFWWWRRSQRQ